MTKGLEMPVSLLVTISIAVLILVGVVIMIGPRMGWFVGATEIEVLKARHCGAYVRGGCIDTAIPRTDAPPIFGLSCHPDALDSTADARVMLAPRVDTNGNGFSDSLLTLMRTYTRTTLDMAGCKRACGCPGY